MTENLFDTEMPGKGPFEKSTFNFPEGLIEDKRLSTKSKIVVCAILSCQQYFEVEDIELMLIAKFLDISESQMSRCIKEINETVWLKK